MIRGRDYADYNSIKDGVTATPCPWDTSRARIIDRDGRIISDGIGEKYFLPMLKRRLERYNKEPWAPRDLSDDNGPA